MTFEDYATEVRQAVFPDGEADNLIPKHTNQVADALCDLQHAVKCLQNDNQTRWRQGQTRFICGTSAVTAPSGVVRLVKSIRSGNACDVVTFDRRTPADFACQVQQMDCCRDETDPPMALTRASLAGGPAAPRDIEAYPLADDSLNRGCRTSGGMWTIDRSYLKVFPSLDSNEMLVALWDGIQVQWENDTVMPENMLTRDARRAVELYLEAESARFETESLKDFEACRILYAEQVKKLVLWCRSQRQGRYGMEDA